MSAQGRKTRTYRGPSIEDVLRQVREELGPDAIVLREREGVMGGIGGFFGTRCVEVDARPPVRLPSESEIGLPAPLPARAVLDVYDDAADGWATPQTGGADADPGEPPELAEEPSGELASPAEAAASPTRNGTDIGLVPTSLLEKLERQASPFADALASAVAREIAEEAHDETEPATPGLPEELEPEVCAEPEVREQVAREPEVEPLAAAPDAGAAPARRERLVEAASARSVEETAIVRDNLLAAGIAQRAVDAILDEVRLHRRPLAPEEPVALHARRALARRIRVRHGWRGRQRTIAVVGPSRSGRTLTAARLCHAYATGGRSSTAALSLESARQAFELGALTRGLSIELEIAASPAAVSHALARLDAGVVVADTPAANPYDAASVERVAELLEALRPDETHLLVPARLGVHEARILLDGIRPQVDVDRLLLTRLDEQGDARAGIALALESRLPISYLAVGAKWGLRPAESAELAELVLP